MVLSAIHSDGVVRRPQGQSSQELKHLVFWVMAVEVLAQKKSPKEERGEWREGMLRGRGREQE